MGVSSDEEDGEEGDAGGDAGPAAASGNAGPAAAASGEENYIISTHQQASRYRQILPDKTVCISMYPASDKNRYALSVSGYRHILFDCIDTKVVSVFMKLYLHVLKH